MSKRLQQHPPRSVLSPGIYFGLLCRTLSLLHGIPYVTLQAVKCFQPLKGCLMTCSVPPMLAFYPPMHFPSMHHCAPSFHLSPYLQQHALRCLLAQCTIWRSVDGRAVRAQRRQHGLADLAHVKREGTSRQ